jgi:hypothetical protein
VFFSVQICGSVLATRKGVYQGLAYMLIYTGAVAVLFVVVLLLVDSRESGLGSLLVARSGFVGVILSLSLGFAFVPSNLSFYVAGARLHSRRRWPPNTRGDPCSFEWRNFRRIQSLPGCLRAGLTHCN